MTHQPGDHTYSKLPDSLLVREVRAQIVEPGFRTTVLVIATTPLNAQAFTKADLAQHYRARWNAELDLRSLKQTMRMDILRCKTPELVRKEIWTHLLGYNLIRTIMAQAARAIFDHWLSPVITHACYINLRPRFPVWTSRVFRVESYHF